MIFRVIKEGTYWYLKSGKSTLAKMKVKAKIVDVAFRFARKYPGCKVRLYSASGHLQVESNW